MQMQLFFFPSTRNRLYMPRARNCLRSRQRAGLDTASMMLKPACNGKPRRKSSTMLQEWPPAPPPFNGLSEQLEGSVTLERLILCECHLDSRTQNSILRATV